jgi:hypothetical protein
VVEVQRARAASVRAITPWDLFVLHNRDFDRVLRDHPAFAAGARSETARRYGDAGR